MVDRPLPALPPRPPDGHKGTFGTVCVIGGQVAAPRVMVGGPAFTAMGALRVGAGLAVLAVPRPLMTTALEIAPSATGLALPVDDAGELVPSAVAELLDRQLGGYDCLAVGPGLGDGPAQRQIMARLVSLEHPPMVIDADGLNALAAMPDFHRDVRAPTVLTPHPGEYRRLAAVLGIAADPVDQQTRPDAAAELARRLGCVVVLKGAATVVSDGLETWTNHTGNVALATAGTGDVLAGIIAGLVAQFGEHRAGAAGRLSLMDCARVGVHVHGLAADRWADAHGDAGLIAPDLLDLVPDVLAELRG